MSTSEKDDRSATSARLSSAGSAAAAAPAPQPANSPKITVLPSTTTAKALPGIEKLEAGIREIVEAELLAAGARAGKLDAPADPDVRPKRWDVLFLIVGVINLVMLVWMIPGKALQDERIKFLKDLIPWVFGSLFVLVTRWYHETILKLSRSSVFRVTNIALLVLLVALWLPVVSLPAVDPEGAQLMVDDGARPLDLARSNRVSLLREHMYRLVKNENGKELNERTFKLAGLELWNEMRRNDHLHWSLLYPVRITSTRKGIKLLISRQGSVFDNDFLRGNSLDKYSLRQQNGDARLLQYAMPSDTKTATTQLPVGHYRLTLEASDCRVEPESLTKEGLLAIDPKDKVVFVVKVTCQ